MTIFTSKYKVSFIISSRYEDGVLLPRLFVTDNWAERIRNFEVREDDIWILSYPKTGTTWTIELVWMLVNDLKLETADIPEHLRCPIMEGASVITCDFLQSQGMKPDDPKGAVLMVQMGETEPKCPKVANDIFQGFTAYPLRTYKYTD